MIKLILKENDVNLKSSQYKFDKSLQYEDVLKLYNSFENYGKLDLNNLNKNREIPICIMSKNFDKKRAKFLNLLLNNSTLNRKYFIFTQKNEEQEFNEFNKFKNIQIVAPNEKFNIASKRNYIIDYCKEKCYKNLIIIEDDITDLTIPLYNSNKVCFRFSLKYHLDLYFDIFEQILLENDYIKFCGVYDDITLFSKRKLINDFGQPVKIIFIDLNTINDLKYDEKSGWDDSDFILQCICNDIIPYSISLSYKCDKTTANSQTTFEESNVDRYNRFTNMFIKKMD